MAIKAELSADVADRSEGPTQHPTKVNRFRLHCASCGEHYYVDLATFRLATSAIEGDASEVRFSCRECLEQTEEERYGH